MLDAKDRKGVLKTLKDDIKEMFTNKLAYLFLIHVLNNLDDTTLSKKKIKKQEALAARKAFFKTGRYAGAARGDVGASGRPSPGAVCRPARRAVPAAACEATDSAPLLQGRPVGAPPALRVVGRA
jgi:hypothetical protein